MSSTVFTIAFVFYFVFFSYRYHLAKKKHKRTGCPQDYKKMLRLCFLMQDVPLILVFIVLPIIKMQTAVSMMVGLIAMFLPYLLG